MSAPIDDAPALHAELRACLEAAAPARRVHATDAAEAALRAQVLADRLARPEDAAQAAVWRCTHLLRLGRNEDVLREGAAARPQLEGPACQDQRRELLRLITLAGSEAGDFDIALGAAHELVQDAAGDTRNGAALSAALALAVCFERMGDSWQALRLLEDALRDHGATAAGLQAVPPGVQLPLLMTTNALCATTLGIAHRLAGLGADADAERAQVLATGRAAGERARALLQLRDDPSYRVAVQGNLGEIMLFQGESEAAGELLRASQAQARALGLRAHAWRVQATLAAWRLDRGDAVGALSEVETLLAAMGATAPPQTLVRAHQVAWRACRALGRGDDALRHFETAERIERRRTNAQLRAQSLLFVTRSEARQAQWQADQARVEAQRQRERAAQAVADAERDPLTGLGNRRHLAARCAELLHEAQRGDRPLTLALLDIDRFKDVNDSHGHAVGDQVLMAVAQMLRDDMRSDDVLVRHGGEEFVIVLPGQTLASAAEACERLRQRVAGFAWATVCGQALEITASIGLAAAPPWELHELLERADGALYAAKRGGRDRVVCAG